MWETVRPVVNVIAYPAITGRHGEAVCVAGIRSDHLMEPSWVRLFPFRGRTTADQVRVHKWNENEVHVRANRLDNRPESRKPDLESIQVVGHLDTNRGWSSRRALVDTLPRYETIQGVLTAQRASKTSLAVVDTGEILDLEITRKPAADLQALESKARSQLSQGTLFDIVNPTQPLEPMPVDFHYVIQYADETSPRQLKIIDWKINHAWRKWCQEYSRPEVAIRDKWLGEVAANSKDVSYFVGNRQAAKPNATASPPYGDYGIHYSPLYGEYGIGWGGSSDQETVKR